MTRLTVREVYTCHSHFILRWTSSI